MSLLQALKYADNVVLSGLTDEVAAVTDTENMSGSVKYCREPGHNFKLTKL